jgi:uncharacterized membrane protein
MDAYTLIKFLHVSSAIVWIGAVCALVFLGVAADRQSDRDGFMRIMRHIIYMAPRYFVPTSLIAFVLGFVDAWLAWGFSTLWVWLGIIGFAASSAAGNLVLRPRAEKIARMMAVEGNSDAAVAMGRELLLVAKFDLVLLFLVVADMVFKPMPSDWLVLALMAVVLIAGAAAFLTPVLRRAPRPATT